MRKPVTTDVSVLQGWPKGDKPVDSASVAKALGITVFQITARLKGMEGRNLVARVNGQWKRTDAGMAEAKNPSPSVAGNNGLHRKKDALGVASGPPDDTHVPLLKLGREQWAPSEDALEEAKQRLPKVEARMRELDKKENRKEWLTLQVERDHCKQVIGKKREGCWTLRRIRQGTHQFDLYVAPDGREYVRAENHEVADLRISMPTGFDPARLRLFMTSALSRRTAREQREIDGRKAARKERNGNGEVQARSIRDDVAEDDRSKAEAAFYKLSAAKRDAIRASGKYETYDEWFVAAKERRREAERQDSEPVKAGGKQSRTSKAPGGKAKR